MSRGERTQKRGKGLSKPRGKRVSDRDTRRNDRAKRNIWLVSLRQTIEVRKASIDNPETVIEVSLRTSQRELFEATVKLGSDSLTRVAYKGSVSGRIEEKFKGLLKIGRSVEYHDRVPFVRRKNSDILLTEALESLVKPSGDRRARMEEGLQSRYQGTTKERNIRERVFVRGDEAVERGNDIDRDTRRRTNSKRKTEA